MPTGPDGAKMFLTGPQNALMIDVLDRIIPREGKFPGAAEHGVVDHIDRIVGKSRNLRRLFSEGLASVDMVSLNMYSKGFSSLSDEQRDAVLRRVESERGEFFEALVRHTYAGYYSSPAVIRLLGLEARPPQPMGYQLDPFDPGLLERVKKQGKIYRDA